MQLPILTLPFVIATSLFMKLSGGSNDLTFPWPTSISFPEKERYNYLARREALRKVGFSTFFTHIHSFSLSRFYAKFKLLHLMELGTNDILYHCDLYRIPSYEILKRDLPFFSRNKMAFRIKTTPYKKNRN